MKDKQPSKRHYQSGYLFQSQLIRFLELLVLMVVWVFQTLDFGVEFLHSWLSVIFMGSLCVVIGGNFVSTMCKSMSKGETYLLEKIVMNDWAAGRYFMRSCIIAV